MYVHYVLKMTFLFIEESAIEAQLIKWNQVRVETINDRTWRAVVPPSYDGFRALMIEVSFSGPDDRSKVGSHLFKNLHYF